MASLKKPQGAKKAPVPPRPSASILLISPTNQILLLHRVRTSSSFPLAHVFPGGNLSAKQDGDIPDVADGRGHQDSKVYRLGAIRECFEESGILLAKRLDDPEKLLELKDEERENGRHAIHTNSTSFKNWLKDKGGVPDIDALIPFTRWVTPANLPKRFSAQMYLYFLPLPYTVSSSNKGALPVKSKAIIPNPTSDGGIEHTAARFLPPSKWLSMARSGEIILFPPQFYLLHLLAPLLSPENIPTILDPNELARQREMVIDFVKSGDPPWTDKCMMPTMLGGKTSDGRTVLGLDRSGVDSNDNGRKGDSERVVLVNFQKEGPRNVEVAWKNDIFQQERARKEKL